MDRYLGCMLGLAAGEALGTPLAGLKEGHIRQLFGEVAGYLDPIAAFADRPGKWGLRGLYGGATQQALAVAEVLAVYGGGDPPALADLYVRLLDEGPPGAAFGSYRGAGHFFRRAVEAMRDKQKTLEGRQDASGTGRQDASGTGRQDASGTGRQDASGTCRQDASGTGRRDASGTGRQDASGTGRRDASGTGRQDASGTCRRDASGTGRRDASGTCRQDASGTCRQDASGTGRLAGFSANDIPAGGSERPDEYPLRCGQPSPDCGAAARIAPVGLFFSDDPEALSRAAIEFSLMTHSDPRAVAAALAVARAVGLLAGPGGSGGSDSSGRQDARTTMATGGGGGSDKSDSSGRQDARTTMATGGGGGSGGSGGSDKSDESDRSDRFDRSNRSNESDRSPLSSATASPLEIAESLPGWVREAETLLEKEYGAFLDPRAGRDRLHAFSSALEALPSLVRESNDMLAEQTILRIANDSGPGDRIAQLNADFAPACVLAALYRALSAHSFESGLIAAINAGGVAASAGAIAGALLGARFGRGVIPDEWLEGLLNAEQIELRAQALFEREVDWIRWEDTIAMECALTQRERDAVEKAVEANRPRLEKERDRKMQRQARASRHGGGGKGGSKSATEDLGFAPPPQVWLGGSSATDRDEMDPIQAKKEKALRGRKRISWKDTRRQKRRESHEDNSGQTEE